jgi:hypothetical protein
MGKWPEYNREDYLSTLNVSSQVSRERLIGVKDASGENAEGTIVVNHKRGSNWSVSLIMLKTFFTFSFNLGSATLGNIGTVEYIDAGKPVSSLTLVS